MSYAPDPRQEAIRLTLTLLGILAIAGFALTFVVRWLLRLA